MKVFMKNLLLSFMLYFVFLSSNVNAKTELFTITNGFIPNRYFEIDTSMNTIRYNLNTQEFLNWVHSVLSVWGFQNVIDVQIGEIVRAVYISTDTEYVVSVQLRIETED